MRPALQRGLKHQGRWLPAALALALIAAQGSTIGHFALVRHAYCADHGELVHPDGTEQQPTAGRSSKHLAMDTGEGDEHRHGHDHCVVVGQRRDALVAAESASPVLDRDANRELPSAELFAPSTEPRFRLAPKQSPPA